MDISFWLFIFAMVVGAGTFLAAYLLGDERLLPKKKEEQPFSLDGVAPYLSVDKVGDAMAFPSDEE